MPFRLVQRLEAAPDGRAHNPFNAEPALWVAKFLLDAGAKVDLAYMGRSEYEHRPTLVGSANRIAVAARDLKIVTRSVAVPKYSGDVHFICTEQQAEEAIPTWESWARDPITAEPTGFFTGEGREQFDDVVGWWALEEDLVWTKKQDVAEDIRGAFGTILDNVSGQ